MVDLSTCPHCDKPLVIESVERLTARSGVELRCEDGVYFAEFDGCTDYGDDMETLYYQCRNCFGELPEEYQQEIDRLMGNSRVFSERR